MATTNFLKLRGLPFAATPIDILSFLAGLPVWNEQSVSITMNNDGRPSGEALIKLEQFISVNDLIPFNGRYLGNRFIEVFPLTQNDYFVQDNRQPMMEMTLVRLRGLPYDTSNEDILMFFGGLMISIDGVGILIGPDDIPTGEAFVQFMTREEANMALQRHNQCIRSRYIEIYKSSLTEAIRAMERQYEINKEEILKRARNSAQAYPPKFNSDGYGQGNRGAGGPMRRNRDTSKSRSAPYGSKSSYSNAQSHNHGFSDANQTTIFMRGLPYSATEQDVYEFFAPLSLATVRVFRGNDGRPTGEAEAEFLTQDDAIQGMEKDRCKMSWRYIELFTQAPEKV